MYSCSTTQCGNLSNHLTMALSASSRGGTDQPLICVAAIPPPHHLEARLTNQEVIRVAAAISRNLRGAKITDQPVICVGAIPPPHHPAARLTNQVVIRLAAAISRNLRGAKMTDQSVIYVAIQSPLHHPAARLTNQVVIHVAIQSPPHLRMIHIINPRGTC